MDLSIEIDDDYFFGELMNKEKGFKKIGIQCAWQNC